MFYIQMSSPSLQQTRSVEKSILIPPTNKYDFFNIRFPDIQEFGDTQLRAFWMFTDINYSEDGRDFNSLPHNVRTMVEMTIGFFFSSDGIVFHNIGDNFKNEILTPEAQYTYSAIETIEMIHAQSYGLQLASIITDPKRKDELMNAIETIPSVKLMSEWAIKYTNRNNYSLIERLIAFLCVEGIFFSGPFASIFWLRKYYPGKLKGIVGANDLISRDESIHGCFAAHIIKKLKAEGHSTTKVFEIVNSAVEIACNFARDSLPVAFIDMNSELMTLHIKSVANRWVQMIDEKVLYPMIKNTPFGFMENTSLSVKKNFFEQQATEYAKCPPMNIDYSFDVSGSF